MKIIKTILFNIFFIIITAFLCILVLGALGDIYGFIGCVVLAILSAIIVPRITKNKNAEIEDTVSHD